MNELQRREFEMLKLFLDICRQEQLQYYLVCGSALGAVKYQGFIPWDDDIDVALPREDYEKFIASAQQYLPDWCFLQNYHTEPEFCDVGSKLRDSRTTYIEQYAETLHINHGVFIDVFPLDAFQKTPANLKIWQKKRRRFDIIRQLRHHYRRIFSTRVFRILDTYYYVMFRLFHAYADTPKYIAEYEQYIRSFAMAESDTLCNHGNSRFLSEFSPKDDYGKGITATFEGLSVTLPEQYDAYLTQKYGKWRDDLPIEEQKGHHHTFVCDLDKPYTFYIKENY